MATGHELIPAYSIETLANETGYTHHNETLNVTTDTNRITRACIIGIKDEVEMKNIPDSKLYFEIKFLIENFFHLQVVYSKNGEEYKDANDLVLVIKEFGNQLRTLQQFKCISFQVLKVLYHKKEPILPRLKSTRPVYCFSMAGMCFALSGFQTHDVRRAVDLIHYMSGHVRRTYKADLYLIAKSTKSDHYEIASSSKKVLTMKWLEECWARRDDMNFNAEDNGFMDKYSLKCFGGLSLYFYGFPENEIRDVKERTIENGGEFVTNIAHASHIIVHGDALLSITREILYNMGAQHDAYIVTCQWFWKSIHLDYCYSEHLFDVFNRDTKVRTKKSTGTIGSNKKRKSRGGSKSNLDTSNTSGALSELMYSTDSIDSVALAPLKHNDKRYQVCVEMLDTERNYCNSLELMIKMFKEPLEATLEDENHHPIVSKCEISMIFGKIQPILNVHRNILNSLIQMMENWDSNYNGVKIGYVWAMHGPDLARVYPPFVNSYDETRKTLDECLFREKFLSFVKTAESDPKCRKITLKDMLIKPVQRLPSVVLLLNEILKRTDTKHQDTVCLRKAIEEIESVLKSTNHSRQLNDQFREFLNVTNEIEGFPPEFVNSSRHFKKRVDVHVLNGDGLFYNYRNRIITLFLFDDMIMFTKNRVPVGSSPNLSQSFIQNPRGTISRNMSFLKSRNANDKKLYKLLQTFRIIDVRLVRFVKTREIMVIKVRDLEDGDLLLVGNSPDDNFRELLNFMNQLCNLVTQYNGKDLRVEELTPNMMNDMQYSEDEDYRAVKKAIDILHGDKTDNLKRRSTLRRAMSNISINITHGIQKFTSRANLSFINENSSH